MLCRLVSFFFFYLVPVKVWLIAGCSAGKNTCPQRRGNAKTPCSLKRKRGNNEIIKVTQAPPGLLSLLPPLPSFYLSSLPLTRLSNWSKINRQINEWIHGWGRVDLLSAVLPRNAAQRSALRKALLLFLGSIFFGSSPPSAGAPPSLSSSRASVSRACVFRGFARVFLRPPQLICGSRSDTAQPKRTLVGRSSPDRRLICSTPPLFPTPLTPFFLDPP